MSGKNHHAAGNNYNPNMTVLARVPTTDKITATYLRQLSPEHEVVAGLGNPEHIVDSYILPDVKYKLEGLIENEKMEFEGKSKELRSKLESFSPEVQALVSPEASASMRILPLLDIILDSGKGGRIYNLLEKVRANEPLKESDIQPLVKPVYRIINTRNKVPRTFENALWQYVKDGEADEYLQNMLSQAVPVFKEVAEYKALASQLELIGNKEQGTINVGELKKALVREVTKVSSGSTSAEVNGFGEKIDVYTLLQELTGMREPEKPSLQNLENILRDQNSLILPFKFNVKSGSAGLPENLEQSYLPIQKFGQIVTYFDNVIRKVLMAYAVNNEEIQKIDSVGKSLLFDAFSNVAGGILMNAVFPKDHSQILTLYATKRLKSIDTIERANRIVGITANCRQDITKVAAEYLGVPIDQTKFDEFIALQSSLMPFLPKELYDCLAIQMEFYLPVNQFKQHMLTPAAKLKKLKYNGAEILLKRNFGLTVNNIGTITEETEELAAQLFGDKFAFASQVYQIPIKTSNGEM